MRRLDKADPTKQHPPGVKAAKWTPVVIIPSLGVSGTAAGTKLANLRRQGPGAGVERDVRIRFGSCCDEHKGQVELSTLAGPDELMRRAKMLSDHIGHGRLEPSKARLEWIEAEPNTACTDCLELAAERAAAAAAPAKPKGAVA